MIYYPLTTLMYSGVNEILIISTPHDLPVFQRLLGDGSCLGCVLVPSSRSPNGLAQAFVLGKNLSVTIKCVWYWEIIFSI